MLYQIRHHFFCGLVIQTYQRGSLELDVLVLFDSYLFTHLLSSSLEKYYTNSFWVECLDLTRWCQISNPIDGEIYTSPAGRRWCSEIFNYNLTSLDQLLPSINWIADSACPRLTWNFWQATSKIHLSDKLQNVFQIAVHKALMSGICHVSSFYFKIDGSRFSSQCFVFVIPI